MLIDDYQAAILTIRGRATRLANEAETEAVLKSVREIIIECERVLERHSQAAIEWQGPRMSVHITRAPSDPICPRVSVGGNAETGFYCTFRGPAKGCINALKVALRAMETAESQLDALPVDRRYKEIGAS